MRHFDRVLVIGGAGFLGSHLCRQLIATMRAGAAGTAAALNIARRRGARLILASTSAGYDDPQEHPQRETYWGNVNPVGRRSVYDEAKRYAEALVFAYRREGFADVGVARIFNTYGPGMRTDDGGMVPTFCRQALRGEPITVAGDGTRARSLRYVDDTVAGLLALARSDFAGPVNIGNPQELTVLTVAELVKRLSGSRSPIVFMPTPADDPRRRCPDVTLAAKRLGWKSQGDYAEGLRRTIDWFRASTPEFVGLASRPSR